MAQVHVRHQKVVVPNLRDPGLLFAAAIDRDVFANDIPVADDHLGIGTLVTQILRLGTDHGSGKYMISFADGRIATERDVVLDDRVAADFHARADHAIVADVNPVAECCSRIDNGGGGDGGAHGFTLPLQSVRAKKQDEWMGQAALIRDSVGGGNGAAAPLGRFAVPTNAASCLANAALSR